MKGILLAGGSGTRLHPMTLVASKQLLPVYDKPMVYYPLGTLMLAGIRDILLISTPQDLPQFQQLLGDGRRFGVRLSYAEQPKPEGIPQAFQIGADWIGEEPCTLALGDNIIYGDRLPRLLQASVARAEEGKSTVFAFRVADPERYGVVEFDADGRILSLEEKPRPTEVELGGDRALCLRSRRSASGPSAGAVPARRARNHGPEPHVFGAGSALG